MALTTALLPAALMLLVAAFCAGLSLTRRRLNPGIYRWIGTIGLVGAIVAALLELYAMRASDSGVGLVSYGGAIVADRFSVFCTVTFALLASGASWASTDLVKRIPLRAGALQSLILVTAAAASLLASQREMTMLFLTSQLLAACGVLLAAIVKTDRRGSEAAFKHLVVAGISAALLLYGLAILYGISGSTDLGALPAAYVRAPVLSLLGLSLVLLGLTAGAGLLPLRQWLSLSAEGAPAPLAGFVVAVSVAAGAAAYARLGPGSLGAFVHPWIDLTALVATATIIHSALALLRSPSLRQLIGHLAGVQAALMLLAIVATGGGAASRDGVTAFLFVIPSYGFAVVGLFALIEVLETAGSRTTVDACRGLGRRTRLLGLSLTVAVASLAGIPPLAGSIGWLLIAEAAFRAGHALAALVAVASVAVAMLACGRFIAALYVDPGDEGAVPLRRAARGARGAAYAWSLAPLFLAVLAQPILNMALGGARALTG